MENNLYYTPTLKDLHYGFEFEYKSKDDNWVKITLDTWNRPSKDNHLKYFTEYDLLRTLNHQDMACKYADLTCIRVKYLDQSDIESLGWEHLGSQWYSLKEVPGKLGYWNYVRLRKWKDHNIFIEGYRADPVVFEETEQQRLFDGDIKNKSELIKLMQQLNIK